MVTSPILPATTVPFSLSSSVQAMVDSGVWHDFLIDGVPFLLMPSGDDPYVRDVPEGRRDQFDNSQEAGEQSFAQWWLRSQGSFHGGAGQRVLDADPRSAEVTRTRFDESVYADVWTPGEVSVASSFSSTATDTSALELVVWSGQRRLAKMSGASNEVVFTNLPTPGAPTVVTLGAAGIPQSMCTDGENVFVACDDSIWRVDSAGTALKIATVAFSGPVVLDFAKQRLVLAVGPDLHIVDPDPPVPPVALGVAFHTNPIPAWRYTSAADGPNGIYLSGYSGSLSQVESIGVSESGGTLVLGVPTVQMKLPPDELVNELLFYVNSFFVLATSNGVRVGTFTPYGQPQFGGLSLEGLACHSLAAGSNRVVVGADDSIWWIDLATQIDASPRWATAKWAHALATSPGDHVADVVAFRSGGEDLVCAVTSGTAPILLEQAEYAPFFPAFVSTSWVRFGTVELKQLHYLAVEGRFPLLGGGENPLEITVEASTGESQTVIVPGGRDSYELTITAPPAEAFRLIFRLRNGGLGVERTRLTGFQMKALPRPRRFLTLMLPLSCADSEQDAHGQTVGYDGYARDRLLALEDAAANSRTVTVVDRLTGTSYSAVVERLQFRQAIQPTVTNRMSGTLSLVLRRV